MSTESESVTVTVDTEICDGHGRCFRAAPEVFEPDDQGFARVKIPVVGPELREAVERAAQLCPQMAIAIARASS